MDDKPEYSLRKVPRRRRKLWASRRLRCEATPAEQMLWQHVRHNALGVKVRRQEIVGGFVVDFYCAAAWLVIELDGSIHDAPEVHRADMRRQRALEAAGYRVLRFSNDEVEQGLAGVLDTIRLVVEERLMR